MAFDMIFRAAILRLALILAGVLFGGLAGVRAQGNGTMVTYKDPYNVTYTCTVNLTYNFPANKVVVEWTHTVSNGYTSVASTYFMSMGPNNGTAVSYGNNNLISSGGSQVRTGTVEYSLTGLSYIRFGTSYAGNWYGQYRDAPVVNCQPQTLVVSPAAGGIIYQGQGRQWLLDGSGINPNGGQYKGAIVQGQGSLTVNAETGVAQFVPSAPGSYQLRFWIDASLPDWCRSQDINVSGSVVTTDFVVTVPFDNRSSTLPNTFYVYQDGVLIATRTIPGGERALLQIPVPGGGDVTVKMAKDYTDGSIFTRDSEITYFNVGTYTPHPEGGEPPANPPDAKTPSGYTPPVNPPDKTPDDPTPAPPPSPNKPPAPVWNNSDAVTNDALTNNVAAEGFNKVVEAVDKVRESIDAENAKNDATRAEGDSVRDAIPQDPGATAQTRIETAQAAAAQAANDLESSNAITTIKQITAAGGVSPAMSSGSAPVVVNVSGPISSGVVGGSSIDLSPGRAGGLLGVDFSPFLTWVRHFIAATALIWFAREVIEAVKKACMALAATPQHSLGGTSTIVSQVNVLGNTVGAVPAAAMWGIVIIASTAAIIAAPTLLAASIYTVANVSGLFSGVSTAMSSLATAAGGGGAGAGVLVKVFDLCNLVCPVGLLITIAVNRVLVSISSLVQFVALQVAVKLIGFI